MPNVNVLDIKGNKVSSLDLPESLFAVEVNEHTVYEVVKNHLANKRQGTQSAKTRGEVRGGGKKPWRQKGTGRARQGSIRSPQWRGGGVVFAPKPRDYSYTLPKKVKRLALKSVLTTKVLDEELIVLNDLNLDSISTKEAKNVLQAINAKNKAYLVVAEANENVYKSFRNIPNVEVVVVNNMNVYDLVKHDSLVMTEAAINKAEEVFA
ncbi:50S ribosomal protein L4 [uncultured Helcococcus sp.]|uniref:50S ribosomal protein L4 n=1 Tax=uncultured Helcococcus sp. TaxID=1072508 RepID=UPI0026277626|nr:50S ribosomal protein L4 [uncultured Helcococcus sp.]